MRNCRQFHEGKNDRQQIDNWIDRAWSAADASGTCEAHLSRTSYISAQGSLTEIEELIWNATLLLGNQRTGLVF